MNESYPKKNYSKNYISLDGFHRLTREVETMEKEIFTKVDNLKLSPSKETLKKIFSFL
ncbi:MAG: hypothetical protein II937_08680 [Bacteroidales bacterium]|nr:hypothetical protein [Bacteroidales bacterium]